MATTIEAAFLALLKEKSDFTLSKSNSKEVYEKRNESWSWVAQQLLIKTGKEYNSAQLQKKWNNIQQRVKDRSHDSKTTGGGPPITLSANDRLTWKIIGEKNPKVAIVPGAMTNTSFCSALETSDIVDEEDDTQSKMPPSKKTKWIYILQNIYI